MPEVKGNTGEASVEYTSNKGKEPKKTAAEEYGWDEDWREKLVKAQEAVVHTLQLAVIHDATGGRMSKSGEVKDLAVALGVAVDKLQVLTELYPAKAFGPDAVPTGVLHRGPGETALLYALWERLPDAKKRKLAQSVAAATPAAPPAAPPKVKEARG
jgi:hypothetical protein